MTKEAAKHGLIAGWSLDLLAGWNLSLAKTRKHARAFLEESKPKLLVGPPMCTFSSNLMAWNWKKMKPGMAKRCWRGAVLHLNFAVELYRAQMEAGRLFLHATAVGDHQIRLIHQPDKGWIGKRSN